MAAWLGWCSVSKEWVASYKKVRRERRCAPGHWTRGRGGQASSGHDRGCCSKLWWASGPGRPATSRVGRVRRDWAIERMPDLIATQATHATQSRQSKMGIEGGAQTTATERIASSTGLRTAGRDCESPRMPDAERRGCAGAIPLGLLGLLVLARCSHARVCSSTTMPASAPV